MLLCLPTHVPLTCDCSLCPTPWVTQQSPECEVAKAAVVLGKADVLLRTLEGKSKSDAAPEEVPSLERESGAGEQSTDKLEPATVGHLGPW